MIQPKELLNFFHTCGKLKKVKRTGWQRRGIEDVESVADHCWRLGIMSMMVSAYNEGDIKLDGGRMLKMALIHDLAEVITGDITPGDGVSNAQKLKLESDAMEKILANIDNNGELLELWNEYNDNTTPEAIIIKQLDKLEMSIQAVEYSEEAGVDLNEFYDFSPRDFSAGAVREIFNELLEELANDKA